MDRARSLFPRRWRESGVRYQPRPNRPALLHGRPDPGTARTLACQGVDIILNSLCSNGLDEAHLHIPARAAENGIYMIAANRIGDMVTGADLDRLIAESGMDRETVKGAGESQIVGPRAR